MDQSTFAKKVPLITHLPFMESVAHTIRQLRVALTDAVGPRTNRSHSHIGFD